MSETEANDLRRFFRAVGFDDTDLIEIRTLPPGGGRNQWWMLPGDVDAEWIAGLNATRDVYFGANPRDRDGGSRIEDVSRCYSLVADFDGIDPAEAMDAIEDAEMPPATTVVASGHGTHAYWRLTKPIDADLWRVMQARLAKQVGSDPSIKDPPRIMRIPGTRHVAKGDGAECGVVLVDPGKTYTLEDLNLRADRHAEQSAADITLPPGEKIPLPAWVLRDIETGAPEGHRNRVGFRIAATCAGNGYTIEATRRKMADFGENCRPQLDASELDAITASAYQKQRSPHTIDADGPMVNWTHGATTAQGTREGQSYDVVRRIGDEWHIGEPYPGHDVEHRPDLSNVAEVLEEDKDGNKKRRMYARSVEVTAGEMFTAVESWPRLIGGMLAAPGNPVQAGELPAASAIRWLPKTDSLFAWLQVRFGVFWTTGKAIDKATDTMRTPTTKGEFFDHVASSAPLAYDVAEYLPHYPPIETAFYVPHRVKAGSWDTLRRFADRLNYDTAIDADLMLAAAMTLFWGGQAGQRPAFLFTSQYGQGVGKTTSAQLIADVAGGHLRMSHNEDIDRFKGRLLSPDAARSRCVVVDNVKTKMDVAQVEDLVTASVISGHRMYFGQASRPNYLTWFVTANAPQMSRDLAERSVVIKIGKQKFDPKFMDWMTDYVRENRSAMIGAILDILAGDDRCEIPGDGWDRWSKWQSAVLTKFDTGPDLARAIKERRPEIDADRSDAEDIEVAIVALIHSALCGEMHDINRSRIFIPRDVLVSAMQQVDMGLDSVRKTTTYINNRIGSGPLACVQATKYNGRRGYRYEGVACDASRYTHIVESVPSTWCEASLRNEYDRRSGDDDIPT